MSQSVSKTTGQPVTQQVSESINKSVSWLVTNCKSAIWSVRQSTVGQPFSKSMRQLYVIMSVSQLERQPVFQPVGP